MFGSNPKRPRIESRSRGHACTGKPPQAGQKASVPASLAYIYTNICIYIYRYIALSLSLSLCLFRMSSKLKPDNERLQTLRANAM